MPRTPARRDDGFARALRLAQSLDGVEVGTSYGSPALKVRGKMFACIPIHPSAEPRSLAVRLSFVERDLRLSTEPDRYYLTPHYEPHPTLLVRLDRIGDRALKELLHVAWQFERRPR